MVFISSVNIKPPRHRFGLSLCLGLAIFRIFENILEIREMLKQIPFDINPD